MRLQAGRIALRREQTGVYGTCRGIGFRVLGFRGLGFRV